MAPNPDKLDLKSKIIDPSSGINQVEKPTIACPFVNLKSTQEVNILNNQLTPKKFKPLIIKNVASSVESCDMLHQASGNVSDQNRFK